MSYDALLSGLAGYFDGDARLGERFGALARGRRPGRFRVAVVGGFSRGKTRLVNRLLNTDVFPENVLPATGVLTRICHGSGRTAVFRGETGDMQLPVDAENLEKFCVGGEFGDAAGLLDISWPAPFLARGIELYDTPGMDDLQDARANAVFAALGSCDAAIVAISALSPLGLTEKTFVSSYLLDRDLPRVALAVNFLDSLSGDDAERQLGLVRAAAAALGGEHGGLEVWRGDEPAESLRGRVMAWADDPELAARRERRFRNGLRSLLEEAIARDSATLAALRAGARPGKAGANLSSEREAWDRLCSAFGERALLAAENLRERARAFCSVLCASAAQEPEEIFEASLRLGLQKASASLARELEERLERDLAWLSAELGAAFGVRPALGCGGISLRPDYGSIGLERLLRPAGGLVGQLLNFADLFLERALLMLPPPARLLARPLAKTLLDETRKAVGAAGGGRGQAENGIRKFFALLERQLSELVGEIYSQAVQKAREEEQKWLESQRAELAGLHASSAEAAAARGRALEARLAEGERLLRLLEDMPDGRH